MKERIERAKNFVKEHKNGFLLGTGVALVGGVVFIVAKKKINLNKCVEKHDGSDGLENPSIGLKKPVADLDKPSSDVGVTDDLQQDDFGKTAIVNDFTVVTSMGTVGREFLKSFGITIK